MKKTIIYILLCFAIAASNDADAYFHADTNSIAPVAYYAQDSLSKRIGHENPISTIAAISTIAVPIVLLLSNFQDIFSDYIPVAAYLFTLLGFIGGVIGFITRKKLIDGKYANYPEPRNLPLGQGGSIVGMLAPLSLILTVLLVGSCG